MGAQACGSCPWKWISPWSWLWGNTQRRYWEENRMRRDMRAHVEKTFAHQTHTPLNLGVLGPNWGRGSQTTGAPSQTGGCATEAGEWFFFFKLHRYLKVLSPSPCQFQLLNWGKRPPLGLAGELTYHVPPPPLSSKLVHFRFIPRMQGFFPISTN